MALGGIRDMSTMATPPEERLPISTYVGQYDERLVRQAILRELERGGQVFFVHNRVHNIHAVAQQVQALVPEAQVIVAHGQMDEEQLERTMADFGAGKADVLVCTTIIESGLDMPNVNTLLVHDADRFGLAQLYQLRGRIGRGTSRAFAYFFFPRQRRMTETAERRLETLLEVTAALDAGGLGTGFRLALKDLEIRGAGNLLGAEQSGNMTAVGFDLYSRLLQEAVEELKARQEGRPLPRRRDEATGPTINLPVSAFLPDDYVEDTAMRLALYQRLVQAASPDEVADFEAELRDRFGPVPPPAQELLYVVRLRTLATRASAATVVQEDSQVVVRFPDERALLGKRMLLERLLGQAGQVGNTQFRIRMLEGWQEALLEALRIVAPQGQPGE
jgi:transcription-repair coupling factor (superfamily II helicase)